MATPVKFLFDTSFDPPSPARPDVDATVDKVAEADVPEVYTSADLEAAREQGYAQGLSAGAEQTGAAIDAQISRLLGHLTNQMAELTEDAHEAQAMGVRDSTKLALAIAKKLSAGLLSRVPMAAVETLIETCLGEQYAEPRIVIRVANPMIDPLKQRLETLSRQSGYAGDLVLIADDTFSESKCRVEWADGGAERDPGVLEQTIDAAVHGFIEASFPEPVCQSPPGAGETTEPATPDPTTETAEE